jgi:Ca2+-binding EF-hand superfamily protein
MTRRVSSKLATASTGVLPHVSKPFSARAALASARRPRARLQEVVGSMAFEVLSFLLILASAVIASVQIDRFAASARSGRGRGRDRDRGLAWADEVCLAFFLLEVLLRILAARRKYFVGAMWQWNVLDLALAAWGVLDVSQDRRFAFMYLRTLRFFRLARLVRVTNTAPWLRDLRLMACTLLQSLVSILWACVLLFVVMYCFGACFTYAVATHLEEHTDAEGSHHDSRRLLEELYGSLARTLCTLFLAITNGAEWKTLAEPLGEVHLAYRVIFATYVILVLVGALNVLSSLFVERARELSMSDRDLATQAELASQESFIVEMRRIFDEVDEDKDGLITWQKFRDYLKNEQAQAFFTTQALDTSDAAGLFSLLDKDGKGEVRVEDFALGCMRLRGQAKSSEVATLMRESRSASRKLMTEIRGLKDQLGLMQPSETEQLALHRWPTHRDASRTPSRVRLSRRAVA